MTSRDPATTPPSGSLAVHTFRRILAWTLGLYLLVGTGSALAVAVYPMVTGGGALAVLSGSMTPGLPVGAMVFTRPVDPATVRTGEVITFQRNASGPELVTHRVVAVDRSGPAPVFTTKGDANNAADIDPVPASAVRGRLWFSVNQLGRVAAILHSPKGLGLLIVLVCGVVAVSPGPRPAPARSAAPEGAGDGGGNRVADDEASTAVIHSPLSAPTTGRPPVARPPAALPSPPAGLL